MSRNLQPVAKFVSESKGAFTEPQFRWWIHKSAENGLQAAQAIVRIGRRVYVDLDGFERWVAAQNQQAAA